MMSRSLQQKLLFFAKTAGNKNIAFVCRKAKFVDIIVDGWKQYASMMAWRETCFSNQPQFLIVIGQSSARNLF